MSMLFEYLRLCCAHANIGFPSNPFCLSVEPFRVAHSTPDCLGLVFRSEEGTILHTGDFKIDEHPPDSAQTDLEFVE